MRRIYESSALHRDDEEAHAPREQGRDVRPQALRSVPSGVLSRLFLPHWLRYRAIDVSVTVPDRSFAPGERVPFTVELHNRLPVPVTVPIETPIPWTWSVDGVRSASRIPMEAPETPRGFHFDRGERKRIDRHWSGSIRTGSREWEPAAAGEHTIAVELNVVDARERGLHDETTVTIHEE